ncbi:glycosyltransferase family 2 protein [Litorisediminicola beolgyonensis]|uniref:Glycosyltransferase family 2 protein n=1 Tax=Litorisediminicola beolgyonensis TaxID=1173614 RepID=A0ABW3ZKG5_9RHOB
MRIVLHIGPEPVIAERIQSVFNDKREQLLGKGVLYARGPGAKNHTRLFMAVSDPDAVDTLRFNRGFILPEKQRALFADVAESLAIEARREGVETLILSCHQLGTSLRNMSELARVKSVLAPISQRIDIVGIVDAPARMLARRYAQQVIDGRAVPLSQEIDLADAPSWWDAALATWPASRPEAGVFPELQGAPHWLDLRRLVTEWDAAFGAGTVKLHTVPPEVLWGNELPEALREIFGIASSFGKAEPARPPTEPPAAWLTRARLFNDAVIRMLERSDTILSRPLWRKLVGEIMLDGPPLDPGELSAVSARFAEDLAELVRAHPGLDAQTLDAGPAAGPWQEADPKYGFRATQYLMAFRWRIKRAAKDEQDKKAQELAALAAVASEDLRGVETQDVTPEESGLTPIAARLMPPLAKQKFAQLQNSIYAPHNRIGAINEEELAAPFTELERRPLPENRSGNVIVGCMKNEAPYILEWVAYHRAIGFDDFLIYTNDCEDGTDEILGRLQAMGVLQHRRNNDWKGNSPQQFALNRALKEPVIQNADWIAHIDVDEFINVRCGNGTIFDFLDRVPDATNIAMTWRLFGHSGVTTLEDRFVTEQFDLCAPKYCPKPHTVWGYKTMFRNIGAYAKISCHRPNKLASGAEERVRWVNGSGADMTAEAIKNGWRSSKKSIGYDLLQLNHYALRSAESFLVKRQRGRALHVDRSIGLNYWIRMDWSDVRDITIQRNLPRLRAEYYQLLADPVLQEWHQKGLAWHRAKADELHATPEFEELYQKAVELKLSETERVAYALALDMET